MTSSVQVAVRLRPMNDTEKKHGTLPVVTASTADKSVTVIKGKGSRQQKQKFTFDNVFTSFSTQEEVFEATLQPVIGDIFKGYESTVFAYGQTGTGKTHTMEGDLSSPNMHGVIPRSARAVFETLKLPQYSDHTVTCSYLEIYNEDLGDLLTDGQQKKLEMMEGKNGTFCRGLSEREVSSAKDVQALMHRAQNKRRIGETKMNKCSSRSHCIFTMTVNSNVTLANGSGTMSLEGKLHMVDLAGSECAKTATLDKVSGNEAARERERMNINRSLLTLGRVISILKEQSQRKRPSTSVRIPYRDSKLTRILQESLGGRCKTVIIATLSPSVTAIEESISTLNYAQSANGIINKPVSTSFMAASSSSVMQPSTPSGQGEGGNTVESWHEMECRLQYMQAQVEEAQAALARKHLQQQELVDKAEQAEAGRLKLEKQYYDMTLKLNLIKEELTAETEKRQSAESKLKETRYTLKKTAAVLTATQETEVSLNSEAIALLDTLKESISDGDDLHKVIVEHRNAEVERKQATKSFQSAATAVMEDTIASLGQLSKSTDAHTQALTNSATSSQEDENKSLSATQALLKDIAENVKNVTSAMSAQLLDDGGIVPVLRDLSTSIESGVNAASEAVSDGETKMSASIQSSRDKLSEHASHLKTLESNCTTISEKSMSTLEANIGENKTRITRMVESATAALLDARNARAERRAGQASLISEWKASSLDTTNKIENKASTQSGAVRETLDFFAEEMCHHDRLDSVLSDQRAFLSSRGSTHVDDLSRQANLLMEQDSMVEEARKQQEQTRGAILESIMAGVQDLVTQQMEVLATEEKKHMDSLTRSNQGLTEANSSIAKSAKEIKEVVGEANSILTAEAQHVRKNDMHVTKVMEETNGTLGEIADVTSSHARDVSSLADRANENMTQMGILDAEAEKILENIKTDGEECAHHVESTVLRNAKDGIARLTGSSQEIAKFAEKSIIPDASAALKTLEQSRKKPIETFNHNVEQVVANLGTGCDKLEQMASQQRDAANNLGTTVESKETEFSNSFVVSQRTLIDSRKKELTEIATRHGVATEASLTTCTSQSTKVKSQIIDFTANAEEEVEPAPARSTHSYSTKLSSTPAEEMILQGLDLGPCDADEALFKSDGKNDDSYSQDSCSQDTLSVASDGKSAASASSSPPILNEISVNRDSSSKSLPSASRGRPPGKRNMVSRSRSASTPITSRKKQKRTKGSSAKMGRSSRSIK